MVKDHILDEFIIFRLIAYIQSTTGAAPLDLGSFPAAAKLQQLLNTPQSQLEQAVNANNNSNN